VFCFRKIHANVVIFMGLFLDSKKNPNLQTFFGVLGIIFFVCFLGHEIFLQLLKNFVEERETIGKKILK